MDQKYLLTLAYDGSAYAGFQVQKNQKTVQSTIQDAIACLYGTRLPVTGCSRTDAGVHARDYKLSFSVSDTLPHIPCARLPYALNTYLPQDIAVKTAQIVPSSFHVRHDVWEKEYIYLVHNTSLRDPFSVQRAYIYHPPIDAEMLDAASKAFLGTHDFAGFMAAGVTLADTVRTVRSVSVRREGEHVIFSIAADGFLYHMVRIFVGTMLAVAEGKRAAADLPAVIAARDRSLAGMTVPAHGLYLNRVQYHPSAFFEKKEVDAV